jgi:hypothetical protein
MRRFEFKQVIHARIDAVAPVVLLVVSLTKPGPGRIYEGEQTLRAPEKRERDARVLSELFTQLDGFGSADPATRIPGC